MADEKKPVDPVNDAKLATPECRVSIDALIKTGQNLQSDEVQLLLSQNTPMQKYLIDDLVAQRTDDVTKNCGATPEQILQHNVAKVQTARNAAKP